MPKVIAALCCSKELLKCDLLNSFLRVAIGFLVLSLSFTTQAETVVSGAIAVNTNWAVADGPFVVSGDVVVQGGAKLSIEPGVIVYMGANTKLTVQSGSVSALGTSSNRILVLSDKVRLGQVASAGDWGNWIFVPNVTNSRLDYVTFENGKGLVVNGTSPIFNYLNIKNSLGSAITTDLKTTLSGVGNEASGNTVNGVSVPAGDITTNVKWGLRGIPYVVSAGTVSVGDSPIITSIVPNVIQQGEIANIALTGIRLDGLSGIGFSSGDLSGRILPGATSSNATVEVTANATAALGTFNITALTNAGEAKLLAALSIVPAQPVITSVTPSPIFTNQGNIELTINGRNFTVATEVFINDVVVPSQYISPTQIKAQLENQAIATTISLKLRSPDQINIGQYLTSNLLSLAINSAQLAISPNSNSVAKGFTKTLALTLPYPAPVGGLNVTLVSSVPSVATVPPSIDIPAGELTTSFQVSGIDLGSSTITASGSGFVSAQAQVTIVPPPTLSITPNVLTLGVGRTSSINIQSTSQAGSSGLVVALSSSDTSVATVPGSVTIPAGLSNITAIISTLALGNASIQAQASEYVSGIANVTVRPVSINLPSAALVAPGLTRSIPITLSDPAPVGGLVVNLTSSDSTKVSVPPSITIAEGQLSANVTVTGVGAGAATINATASGYEAAAMSITVEVVTIGVGSPAITSISTPVDLTRAYILTLSRPAPAGGVQLSLATTDGSIAAVSPASIQIPEGQTSTGVVFANVTGIGTGTTTLTVSSQGLNTVSIPVTITAKPTLSFNKGTVIVGKGLRTYISEVNVSLKTGAVAYSPDQPLVVTLTSSDPTKVSVPATVTIPANTASKTFYVTGVDFTNGTPVTIDASAVGYTSPVTKLAATTIAPVYTFQSLDTQRSPASSRDDFYLTVSVPGASYSGNETAAADLPIDLSIVEAAPAGIVDGFYSAATAGTVVTQAVMKAGSNYTYYNGSAYTYSYVGTPTVAGTYKVQANALGVVTNSAVVTVSAPELKFNKIGGGTVIVGKGMKTYVNEVYISRVVNGVTFASPDPLTINLTCSSVAICSVPATVTIPANQTNVYFYVTGVDIGSTTISASAVGYSSPSTDLNVNTIAPELNFSGLSSTNNVGVNDSFQVYLNVTGAYYASNQTVVAPITVNLTSSTPGVESVPSTVTIPINATYSNSVNATGVSAGTTSITASGSGLQSVTSSTITVSP